MAEVAASRAHARETMIAPCLTNSAKEIEIVSRGCVSAIDPSGQTIFVADAHHRDIQRVIVRPGPLGALGPPNGDDNNGGGGNTLDARETSSMTGLRNTDSKDMTGSNTRGDNIRIRNRDSRSKRPAQSRFPQFREVR